MPRYEIVQGHPPVFIDNETGDQIVLSNHTEMTLVRMVVEINEQQEKNQKRLSQLETRINLIEDEFRCRISKDECCDC